MRHLLAPFVLTVTLLTSACDSDGWDFACDDYHPVDFTMHLVGFDDYVGRELHLRVAGTTDWQPPDPGPYEEIFRTSIVIPSGDFSFDQLAGAISCLSLHVDFFVDVNDDGVYDPPPTDHAWRLYAVAWEDDNEMELTFSFTLDSDTCAFDHDGMYGSCDYLDIEWPAP